MSAYIHSQINTISAQSGFMRGMWYQSVWAVSEVYDMDTCTVMPSVHIINVYICILVHI